MPNHSDTIAAVATPPGRGGVGIIRLSGPEAISIGLAICQREGFQVRHAHYARFHDAENAVIDDGLLLVFPAPASFTGEDVVELQAHGGPILLDEIMAHALQLGARSAGPGEFTERAYLNDKLDLAQAEAVADLIDSGSHEAARAARRSLDGEFSNAVNALAESVVALRVFVEAAIDFPDEEVDFLSDGKVLERIDDLGQQLAAINSKASQGRLLRDGINLVIAGRPNAGKSSLLNALARYEAAIVTDIPGTTRDVLRERIQIDGMPLHVIDTAGIRETDDPVEREGVRRALLEAEKADLVLLLIDARNGWTQEDQHTFERMPATLPITIVENKMDLPVEQRCGETDFPDRPLIRLSAKTGQGLDGLHRHIIEQVGRHTGETGSYSARRRHLDALRRAGEHLQAARFQLTEFAAGELVAEELLGMQNALGEITGRMTPDELLGEIFSSFCIGK
ncbi:MAG: tRNA uridine-5-carboxymethylaminomethyl(34) synthesis GTPase MnmE [Gammaproteobacteria bacterium]